MRLDEYQTVIETFDLYPDEHRPLVYALGAANELGELLGKLKKQLRGDYNGDLRAEVMSEFGDVLWYLGRLASHFEFCFSEAARYNIEKLERRKKYGTIQGEGDTR